MKVLETRLTVELVEEGRSLDIVCSAAISRVEGEILDLVLRAVETHEELGHELQSRVYEVVTEVLAARAQRGAHDLVELAESWRGE